MSAHPPKQHQGVADIWRQLNRRTKAVLVALVAFLAGFQTIRDQAAIPLWHVYSHRQPSYDAQLLSGLRPGILLSVFQEELKYRSSAILRHDVMVPGPDGKPLRTRDELFVLKAAYVEAFVDDSQSVVGYTITMRVADAQIHIGSTTVGFGRTTIASAHVSGPDAVGGGCGVHLVAYYEVSRDSHADNDQRFAVGNTDAGYEKRNLNRPLCPDSNLPKFSPPDAVTSPDEGLYVADLFSPTDEYMRKNEGLRRDTLVNAVSITASGFELAPEMLSLHPDFLRQFASPGD
jgi:hypothetical protein